MVTFILVEPQLPENIGAAARALKTMGFQHLRLVRPVEHLSERALWVAHGSQELLKAAQLYDALEEAVADLDFCIGTTVRPRHARRQLSGCPPFAGFFGKKGGSGSARRCLVRPRRVRTL